MTKLELIECMIPSLYSGELTQEVRLSIIEMLMRQSDKELLEELGSKGLHFEKIGNIFISKN